MKALPLNMPPGLSRVSQSFFPALSTAILLAGKGNFYLHLMDVCYFGSIAHVGGSGGQGCVNTTGLEDVRKR